ncbi:uncharacterized protein Dwil_GK27399 [Drosophila willistoni]|nr:uncharacterized protein LOC26529401 [Drosophila willistoni]KRF97870.1 uncharacterized protein Dwil_GK27399 [Drosophila willistoni]
MESKKVTKNGKAKKTKKNKKNEKLPVDIEPIAEAPANSSSSNEEESNEEVEESAQCSKSVSSIKKETHDKKDQAEEEQDKEVETKKRQFSPEDIEEMMALSRLPEAALAAYIQELDTEVYEWSQREARELSRSKHLRIFGNNRRRANKRE